MTTLGHRVASRSDGRGRATRTARLTAVSGPYGGVGGAAGNADDLELLGPFSLDNVTATVSFIGGSLGCCHAPQNLQNRQNQSAGEVL